jgi:DNA repair protein RadC
MKIYNPLTASRITVSVIREDSHPGPALDEPARACRFWHDVIAAQPDHEPDKETLVGVLADVRLRPYAWNRVSLGTLTEACAHPREIFRPVIAGAAHGFVMLHNHPSGDPSPSSADRAITRRIADAARLLQIRLLDHIIIGGPPGDDAGYFSFLEHGLI